MKTGKWERIFLQSVSLEELARTPCIKIAHLQQMAEFLSDCEKRFSKMVGAGLRDRHIFQNKPNSSAPQGRRALPFLIRVGCSQGQKLCQLVQSSSIA